MVDLLKSLKAGEPPEAHRQPLSQLPCTPISLIHFFLLPAQTLKMGGGFKQKEKSSPYLTPSLPADLAGEVKEKDE